MFITKRPTVEAVEHHIGVEVPLLDHGYVKLWDYLGDDNAIVQAARVSYQSGTKTKSDDVSLIKYLLEHFHTTPFEMCEIKIEMKLPIFVARQLIRHRTANVNEMSARYSILEKEFYIPAPEHCAPQSKTNKQGRDENGNFDWLTYEGIKNQLTSHSELAYQLYTYLLGEDAEGNEIPDGKGLARELSRMALPVNFYTRWVWKIDLHNLMNFLRLRMDSHAQYEIRVYADAIYNIVKDWVPAAAAAFDNAIWQAKTFTGEEMRVFKDFIDYKGGIEYDFLPKDWSKRRKDDFIKNLGA